VMYAGQVAEAGPTRRIFDSPLHPYSRGLLEAFPGIRGPKVPLQGIPGAPPDLSVIQNGCWFSPRCPVKLPECETTAPALLDREGSSVRCLLYAEAEIRALSGSNAQKATIEAAESATEPARAARAARAPRGKEAGK
jgi:peptide/nickel transport system ATP-binding protein